MTGKINREILYTILNAALAEFLPRGHMESAKTYMMEYLQDLQKGGENKNIFKHAITYYSERQEGIIISVPKVS